MGSEEAIDHSPFKENIHLRNARTHTPTHAHAPKYRACVAGSYRLGCVFRRHPKKILDPLFGLGEIEFDWATPHGTHPVLNCSESIPFKHSLLHNPGTQGAGSVQAHARTH
jgi:hypothetical protein